MTTIFPHCTIPCNPRAYLQSHTGEAGQRLGAYHCLAPLPPQGGSVTDFSKVTDWFYESAPQGREALVWLGGPQIDRKFRKIAFFVAHGSIF